MKAWIIRIIKSKTMLFNIFVAVMGVGEAVFGFLQPYIAGNVFGWGMAILTVGNAILRVVTTQPLRDK
jgi:hypothetical protein